MTPLTFVFPMSGDFFCRFVQPVLISRQTDYFDGREPFGRIGSGKPLGNPSPYNVKYFASSELLEQMNDRAWLAKVTNSLNQHWQKRNAVKRKAALW